jgi:hypothetical protein
MGAAASGEKEAVEGEGISPPPCRGGRSKVEAGLINIFPVDKNNVSKELRELTPPLLYRAHCSVLLARGRLHHYKDRNL